MSEKTYDLVTPGPVSRHHMDVPGYCGAACTQMILDYCGVGLLDQAELCNAVSSAGPWATSPADLARTLNQVAAGKLPVPYEHVYFKDREDMMHRLAWSMCHYGLPAVALINDGDHWVIVDGLLVEKQASKGRGDQPKVKTVLTKDPSPDLGSFAPASQGTVVPPPPPPHAATDLCTKWQYEVEAFPLRNGWDGVFTRYDKEGFWEDHYVAVFVSTDHVCLPWDDPPCRPVAAWAAPEPQLAGAKQPPSQTGGVTEQGTVSSDPTVLKELARKGLEEAGLLDRPHWKEVIGPDTTCSVLRVKGLDDAPGYILLVLANRPGERLLVRLDTRSGEMLHALLNPRSWLVDRLVELAEREQDSLVWKPCMQSQSPFYPFVRRTGAKESYSLLGVREFRALTGRPRVIRGTHPSK